LHNIRSAISSDEPVLVSVILDGENCWEHYPEGGVPFLRSLYQMCARDKHVRPVKVGEYLENSPPRDTLPYLFAGSWISHNYAIWIGHDEDNTAWDALHKTREHLVRRSQESGVRSQGTGKSNLTPDACLPTPLQKAWEELYIAEGSDWFWWYGDDHSSAQDALFDYLFRKHLQNVYLLLGDTPPAELSKAIKRSGHRLTYTLPLNFLRIKIDGLETFFEWTNAGRYTCQGERGTMAQVTLGPMQDVYFGFSLREFFVRIDFDQRAKVALQSFEVLRIAFEEPHACELRIFH